MNWLCLQYLKLLLDIFLVEVIDFKWMWDLITKSNRKVIAWIFQSFIFFFLYIENILKALEKSEMYINSA